MHFEEKKNMSERTHKKEQKPPAWRRRSVLLAGISTLGLAGLGFSYERFSLTVQARGASGRRVTSDVDSVIAATRSQLGVPYSWGGGDYDGPSYGNCCSPAGHDGSQIKGFDCAGLVMYAYHQAGIDLSRPSATQYQETKAHVVDSDHIPPGALVFFGGSAGSIHHVGISVGNNRMINAPRPGKQVRYDELTSMGDFYAATFALNGASQSGAAVTRTTTILTASGRLRTFLLDNRQHLLTRWSSGVGGTLSSWEDLGGSFVAYPATLVTPSGALALYACGDDEHIYTTLGQQTNFSSWGDLGQSFMGTPAVVSLDNAGRVQLFALDVNGHIYTAWQESPGSGFGHWTDLGGSFVGNPIAQLTSVGIQIFALGTDGHAYRATATPGSAPGRWMEVGHTFMGDPAIVPLDQDGRLQLFALDVNDHLYTAWQDNPGSGFTHWTDLGGSFRGNPGAQITPSGIQLFALDTNQGISTARGMPGSAPSNWQSLGHTFQDSPSVVCDAFGRLQLFALDTNDDVYTTWQNRALEGFGSWQRL